MAHIGYIKIKQHHFTFVFRHRWEPSGSYYESFARKDWKLGLWFKKTKMVGKKNAYDPKEWPKNLVNCYMLGIDLVVCCAWIDYNKNGLNIKI